MRPLSTGTDTSATAGQSPAPVSPGQPPAIARQRGFRCDPPATMTTRSSLEAPERSDDLTRAPLGSGQGVRPARTAGLGPGGMVRRWGRPRRAVTSRAFLRSTDAPCLPYWGAVSGGPPDPPRLRGACLRDALQSGGDALERIELSRRQAAATDPPPRLRHLTTTPHQPWVPPSRDTGNLPRPTPPLISAAEGGSSLIPVPLQRGDMAHAERVPDLSPRRTRGPRRPGLRIHSCPRALRPARCSAQAPQALPDLCGSRSHTRLRRPGGRLRRLRPSGVHRGRRAAPGGPLRPPQRPPSRRLEHRTGHGRPHRAPRGVGLLPRSLFRPAALCSTHGNLGYNSAGP